MSEKDVWDKQPKLSPLFEAAADLLAALKAITPPIPKENSPCHAGLCEQSECCRCSMIIRAHAAIAKAEAGTEMRDLNRLRRAILLADLLDAYGISIEQALDAPRGFWIRCGQSLRDLGEKFNGDPSPETALVAVDLMKQRVRLAETRARTDNKETPGAEPGRKGAE